MAVTRRLGSVESAKAGAMLDAAEEILKEEGYAALTSRRVVNSLKISNRHCRIEQSPFFVELICILINVRFLNDVFRKSALGQ